MWASCNQKLVTLTFYANGYHNERHDDMVWVTCGLASLEMVSEFHNTSKTKAHSQLRSRSRSSSHSSSDSSSRSHGCRRHGEATEPIPLTRGLDVIRNGLQGLYGDGWEIRRERGEKEGVMMG